VRPILMLKNRHPVLALMIILSLLLVTCSSYHEFITEKLPSKSTTGDIIFISDTQEPIWAETLIMPRNHNIEARSMIFNEILREKPAKVIHLGDLVALGFKDSEWQPIDKFLNNLMDIGSSFYPTLGNHELLFFPNTGEKNFMKRFPFYSRYGYLIDNGVLKIILLNSNFSHLSKEEIKKQQKWYLSTLAQLQQDSTVKAVIVGCHHAPFTNSKIVNPDKNVEKLFVPAFIKNDKCKLFISGHCHAFEHFKYKNKDFMVVGGGGGLQQTLFIGKDEKYRDIYDSKSTKRMFHFLKCTTQDDTLRITLNMINTDFTDFNRSYKIKIPL
jgi:hypothetical protein